MTNEEVILAFLSRNKASRHTLTSDGDTLINYATIIAQRRKFKHNWKD